MPVKNTRISFKCTCTEGQVGHVACLIIILLRLIRIRFEVCKTLVGSYEFDFDIHCDLESVNHRFAHTFLDDTEAVGFCTAIRPTSNECEIPSSSFQDVYRRVGICFRFFVYFFFRTSYFFDYIFVQFRYSF